MSKKKSEEKFGKVAVSAYDMDHANRGLYKVYRDREDPTDDPLRGVSLLDIESRDAKLIFIDGWKGAEVGLVDLGKDMKRRLEEVLDSSLEDLFDAMRGEGLFPVVCSVVTNQDKETTDSLAEMLATAGADTMHLVVRNAYGNDAGAPRWDSLDGLAAELTRADAQFLDLPQLDKALAEELKDKEVKLRGAADWYAQQGQNTYKIKVNTWLKKTDGAWAKAMEAIKAKAGSSVPVLIFQSNKGGVGKSTAAKTCLDFLREVGC